MTHLYLNSSIDFATRASNWPRALARCALMDISYAWKGWGRLAWRRSAAPELMASENRDLAYAAPPRTCDSARPGLVKIATTAGHKFR